MLSFSPDGKQLAVQINDNGLIAIWIYEFARNTLTRLDFGPAIVLLPVWTPDGREVIYNSAYDPPYPSFCFKVG